MSASAPHVDFDICKAPTCSEIKGASVFLAGSIEMGKAIEWQRDVTDFLSHLPVTVLNPRREHWNRDWKQDISEPHFMQQVDWEMDHLGKADVIALFLQPGTKSPISLLELGLHASGGKLVVCCPEGFWKRGNVQIVCRTYGIPLVETLEELKAIVKRSLENAIEQRERS